MLALARRVEWRATGSDLEARLEEARRIVAGRPCYNRALRNRARGWYLEIDWRDPFPRPRVVRVPRRAGARLRALPRARHAGAGRATYRARVRTAELLRACASRSRRLALPCARDRSLLGAMHRRGEFVGLQATGGGRYPRAGRPPLRARASGPPGGRAGRGQRNVGLRARGPAPAKDRLAGRVGGRTGALERPWMERSWMIALHHARPGWIVLIAMVRGRVLDGREAGPRRAGPSRRGRRRLLRGARGRAPRGVGPRTCRDRPQPDRERMAHGRSARRAGSRFGSTDGCGGRTPANGLSAGGCRTGRAELEPALGVAGEDVATVEGASGPGARRRM